MADICIAIDGPAAAGKSTVARLVAAALGFDYLETGAIYRAYAWWCARSEIDITSSDALQVALETFNYELVKEGIKDRHYVNGIEITALLRDPLLGQIASKLAVYPNIRQRAAEIQRKLAKGRSVVVEGRDMGTVVFPDAKVKFFLTASVEARAVRRYQELKKQFPGQKYNLEEIKREIKERDDRDIHRECSPLKKAHDAIGIDTTELSIDQAASLLIKRAQKLLYKGFNSIWVKIIGPKKMESSLLYKFITLFCLVFFKIFYRLRVQGIEHYPSGAAIIAPNHNSFLDPPLIGIASPQVVKFLAKDFLFKKPLLNFLMVSCNAVPVSGGPGDITSMKIVTQLLKEGGQAVIFPEGTRAYSDEILPLKRGVAALASMAKCAVVPTYIDGAHKVWPRTNKIPKFWGKITVVFGKPLYWQDYETHPEGHKGGQRALIVDLEREIKELQATFCKSTAAS